MPADKEIRPAAPATALTPDEAEDRMASLFARQSENERDRETADPEDATGSDEASETPEDEQPEAEASSNESAEDGSPEEEDETSETPEEEAVRKHRVRSRGRDLEVTYDELLAGYSRTDDYTQKTQELAEERRSVQADRVSMRERTSRYDQQLKVLEDAMTAMMPREPDWNAVRTQNPDDYPQLYADWQRYKDRLAAIKQEREQVGRERQEEDGRDYATFVQGEEQKLLTAVPEWRDETKRNAEFAAMRSHASQAYGFTGQELDRFVDSRFYLLVRDAMRYHKLEAQVGKAKEQIKRAGNGAVRPARPGTPGSRATSETAAMKQAVSKLAKTGNVEDAEDAFFLGLQAERKFRKARGR